MMDEKINDNTSNDESPSTEKKNEVKSIDRAEDRKRSKEEKSKKRNIKKAAERFLEAVNDVQTLDEKLDIMCKKYSEIVDDNKTLVLNLKQSEKKIMLLQREKEQFQSERNKALLTRKRLENLCRELQERNKAVKEECLLRLKREEEKLKEMSAKFENTLVQINQNMNLSLEKNAKMQEENVEINKMFKAACDEVVLKEKQLLSVHMQVTADLHVARAKLEKVKIEAATEKEALLKEKQQLLLKLIEYQTQIQELQADKDLTISQEDRTQESSVKEESSNVEMIVEDSSKAQLSIVESSSVASTEKLDEKEDVEKETKEAIEIVNDTSCDDTAKVESSSEVIEKESIIEILIPEKEGVQEKEESKTQSSNQEDKNEKLVENVENKCNGVTTPEVESDSTIEQPVSNDLSDKDIPSEPIEELKREVEVNACVKSQEISAVVENIEETEKSESQILKDSTEANPVVEKQVKTNNPFTKEDNKSIKQTAPATAKNGRRKRK